MGRSEWVHPVSGPLEKLFPNLAGSGYTITSAATMRYNCLAWAAGVDYCWWWPDLFGLEYWPAGAPRDETVEAFAEAYQTLGYMLCDSDEAEAGFEKIAIYARPDGTPTHAARQLLSGQWTSKVGSWEDITHSSLNDLAGPVYGQAVQIMKRSFVANRGKLHTAE